MQTFLNISHFKKSVRYTFNFLKYDKCIYQKMKIIRKGVIQLNGSVLRCEVSAKCPELETVFENCT